MTQWTTEELAEIGSSDELRLNLRATANLFLPAHRIRLEVSSSNFPRFGRNSNTGGDIACEDADHHQPAINRIFHDPAHRLASFSWSSNDERVLPRRFHAGFGDAT
jgi:uncharacterized protein